MTDPNATEALVKSLKQTARAHHEATGGVNSQWSDWYAERLIDDVNRFTTKQRTADELSSWLASADQRYQDENPDMSWPRAYATWLSEED